MSKQLRLLVAFVFSLASIDAFAQTKTWGNNFDGQIGDGFSGPAHVNNPSPVTIGGLADVFAVGGGTGHSLVVKADGTVRSWGKNFSGQLGDGSQTPRPTPVTVSALTNVIAVSGGDLHSLALKSDGTVWAWGDNSSGQLGDFSAEPATSTPVQVGVGPNPTPGFNNIIAIDAGLYHNLALKADGTVWVWGANTSGQLGTGDISKRDSPVQLAGLSNILAIGGGDKHSIALKSDGTVWVWGENAHGQLGDGTLVGPLPGSVQPTPVMNMSISGVAQIAVGDRHTNVLKSNGTVWSWGSNEYGQIGNGTFLLSGCACVPTPTQTSIANVTDIRGNNSFHVLARKVDGSIWAWGYNAYGAIGNGTITAQNPTNYSVLNPAQAIVGTGNVIFGTGWLHSMLSVPVVPAAAGAGVVAQLGEATVTFANVTAPGNVTITAIDPSAVGLPPPAPLVIRLNVQAYNIATTAAFDSATVCIKVPTVFHQAVFNSLQILHGEAGVLVDRTTTRNYARREVCALVNSFSSFVMASLPTPILTGVSSRKSHGGAGTFDLPL